MRLRAKDSSEIMKKLQDVFDCMDSLGISIYIDRYGGVEVIEKTSGESIHWNLQDIENGSAPSELPPMLEYKLTKEATTDEELSHLRKILNK